VGKTRLIKEMAMYVSLRKYFPNGVFYFDFTNVNNRKDINQLFSK